MVCSHRAAEAKHSPASPTGSEDAANDATSCSANRLPSVAALQKAANTIHSVTLAHHIISISFLRQRKHFISLTKKPYKASQTEG